MVNCQFRFFSVIFAERPDDRWPDNFLQYFAGSPIAEFSSPALAISWITATNVDKREKKWTEGSRSKLIFTLNYYLETDTGLIKRVYIIINGTILASKFIVVDIDVNSVRQGSNAS